MPDYRYYTSATWTEGRKGSVSAEGIADPIRFSAPPEFMGEAGTWTPEHFFAAAIASCFVTTFKAIAEFSKFEFLSLQAEVEAILEKEQGGFSFAKVVVQPLLEIAAASEQERALRLLEKAERACLISRSVKSQIELQPEVFVRAVEPTVVALPEPKRAELRTIRRGGMWREKSSGLASLCTVDHAASGANRYPSAADAGRME